MIEVTAAHDVVTIRLAHGKASALDLELVEAVALAFAETAQTPARAVILTGTGSIFSAGVDLFRVTNEGRPYVERFLPALTRMALEIFTFPKPLVTAINGHAIAGGAIIGMMGDVRLMADGNGRFGMPELLVGVAFPPAIVEIVRACVPPPAAQSLMYTGRTVLPAEALRLGAVDEVVAPEALAARAAELAHQLAALPPAAFAQAKRQLRDPAVHLAKRYMGEFEKDVTEQWCDERTLEHIRTYLAKTVKKTASV